MESEEGAIPTSTVTDELKAMQAIAETLDPLESGVRKRVWSWVVDRYGLQQPMSSAAAGSAGQSSGVSAAAAIDPRSLTPKQFLGQKKPKTDIERITCLAYYLTHVRDVQHFTTRDLTELNTEAAGARFSNASITSRDATNRNGYLAPAGKKGERQITSLGEQVVEAMPDRDQVGAVLAEAPKGRRRKSGKSGKRVKVGSENE